MRQSREMTYTADMGLGFGQLVEVEILVEVKMHPQSNRRNFQRLLMKEGNWRRFCVYTN